MKRAIIYARVSTDEQTAGYSIKTQIDAMRKYCAENGFSVVGEYTEDFTGTKIDRPELNRLREHAAREPIDAVIVYDIDRLARKSIYQMLIEEEFERRDMRVIYVNGQYENTDEGRLQKQIRASIAEYERAKILERSKRGKRGKALSGFVLVGARAPYGYRVKSEPHKAWFEIDEDEAAIVRLVYEWYTKGDPVGQRISLRSIAKKLAAMRVPTRGDKQKHFAKKKDACVWTEAMIRHILTAETYAGVWHFGKTQMVSDGKEQIRKAVNKRGLGKQVARPIEEWIAVDVPPIVERETWLGAKARLAENKNSLKGRRTPHQFLLAKRLTCSKCGYRVNCHAVYQKHFYYDCNGRRQIVKLCDMPSFRADLTDETVWQWLKKLIQSPDKVASGLRADQTEAARANRALCERVSIVDSRLADTQAQLEKLLDLYLNGDFPKELLTERKARLENDVADLQHERQELITHLDSSILTDEQITMIETYCAEVSEGLHNATFTDKQRYFELLKVSAKLAVEDGERIIYVQCRIGNTRLSQMRTSPLSNTGAISTRVCGCR